MPTIYFEPLPVSQCRHKDANTWISQSGYVLEYCPNHPKAGLSNRGIFHQHRLILEEYLERVLDKDEIAHHLDENKTNNSIENIELCLAGDHMSHHNSKRAKTDCAEAYKKVIKAAAQDPKMRKKDVVNTQSFPFSEAALNRVLAKYKIPWKHSQKKRIDPDNVERILRQYPRSEAVKILGCSYQWLWNRFPELMQKTANRKLKTPGGYWGESGNRSRS